MATQKEIDAAVAACIKYEGFEAMFISRDDDIGMVTTVITAADKGKNQSSVGRLKAGEAALRAAAVASGRGGQLSDAMCTDIVTATLGAVAALRGK